MTTRKPAPAATQRPTATRSAKAPDPRSFRDAYGVLQTHAETLRTQSEPNIDDLLTIVNESVAAYKICRQRIDAVEKALARALEDTDLPETAPPAATSDAPSGAASDATSGEHASADPGGDETAASTDAGDPEDRLDDLDDDIPF